MAKARFLCTSKTGVETFSVSLEPVLHVKEEHEKEDDEKKRDGTVLHPKADKSFFQGFPYGNITLSALTPEAGAAFKEGQVTAVEFTLED